ncbi:molybdopterin synthase catalytic subunit MoaE [Thalassotalea sp. HSM 43]|uniref:molybdopterin synthase catalytic subunit MoaE n=1 Tax=Thalassotalea sp. HSM 43 TaxID=2552945 RepID=UPI001080AEDB|nr:molybdopterin synthase catalytic subunit MoaE [Thalassotalea sp. HSM 43]QBY03624.1 molybdopterin synthase catalytic subunit MoaE [Thalassotalea sp. HSM 43]
MANIIIKVQQQDFDFASEVDILEAHNQSDGALVTFVGRVRNNNDGEQISQLTLEHYPGMTEQCLQHIAEQACQRWQLGRITIIHRVGDLAVGDKIVFVGVTSKHRKDAYQGNEFIMDYLKVNAPFWKKENTSRGERWVSAKHSDNQEANKW